MCAASSQMTPKSQVIFLSSAPLSPELGSFFRLELAVPKIAAWPFMSLSQQMDRDANNTKVVVSVSTGTRTDEMPAFTECKEHWT